MKPHPICLTNGVRLILWSFLWRYVGDDDYIGPRADVVIRPYISRSI